MIGCQCFQISDYIGTLMKSYRNRIILSELLSRVIVTSRRIAALICESQLATYMRKRPLKKAFHFVVRRSSMMHVSMMLLRFRISSFFVEIAFGKSDDDIASTHIIVAFTKSVFD